MCNIGLRVFEKKNAEYGDTVEETGLLGASVELVGCIARLRQLVLREGNLHDLEPSQKASIENALVDALNYSAIGLHMLRSGNMVGR